jgi:hypothetical protein
VNYLRLFSFSFTLFGYGLISLFVADGDSSQLITIPYRVSILGLVFFLFIRGYSRIGKIINLLLSRNNKIFILGFAFFIFTYSGRLVYEVCTRTMAMGDASSYLLSWFLICLIPSMVFLQTESMEPKKYLAWSQGTLVVLMLLMFSKLSALQQSALYQEQGRLSGEALNPISLGVYSGSLVIISIYYLLNSRRSWLKNKVSLLFSVASVGLGLFFLIAAASRGPTINTFFCVLVLLCLRKITKKSAVRMGYFVAFSALLLYMVSPLIQSGGFNLERILSFASEKDAGSRSDLLMVSLNCIFGSVKNFFLGYGVELEGIGYPHNIVVESFLALGVFGGFVFLVICVITSKRALHLLYFDTGWGWVGLFFIFNFMMSLVSGALYSSSGFWYCLILTNFVWLKSRKLAVP